MTEFNEAPPSRGEMIDIGGRRLRAVREGEGEDPLVVFEAGSFGAAADWGVVQPLVAEHARTLAYDRAGHGRSDPGPPPRNTVAVAADLAALLDALGERHPVIMVAHSMAPVYAYAFALMHPERVAGLVLVDGFPPAALDDPGLRRWIQLYAMTTQWAALPARLGLNQLLSGLLGDRIHVPGEAHVEKLRAFASPSHNRIAASEVAQWLAGAKAVSAKGDLSRELPVATVTAGGGSRRIKALLAEPAHRSRAGYAVNIEGASHTSILGPEHAGAVVKAIDFVIKAARARAGVGP